MRGGGGEKVDLLNGQSMIHCLRESSTAPPTTKEGGEKYSGWLHLYGPRVFLSYVRAAQKIVCGVYPIAPGGKFMLNSSVLGVG